jgi:outer membrane protein OmpA-like peptidoglycan-associated protein
LEFSNSQQITDSIYSIDSASSEQIGSKKISIDSILSQILCPTCDNDSDNVTNLLDACPDVPGIAKNYGCPPSFNFVRPEIVGISFAIGRTDIPNSSQVYLSAILKKLKKNPLSKIRICGYTDNIGEYEDNIKISQRRADAVKNYLISNGISKDRITAIGFGSNNPIADNRTEVGRKTNRRIEIYWD